jgi:5-methylcytosine-specific restriction endonuclease McrA
MGKQDIVIQRFYRSDTWKIARAIKIANACGVCEECGAIGTEVHHIVHLTPENVTDPSVATNQENLKLLCNECHNKAHGRFEGRREYYFDDEGNLIPYKKM